MTFAERWHEIRTGFQPTFWVANSLELFERLAYYGAKAVLTVFLAEKVGLHEEAGTLAGLFNAVLYSLPIVAGVIVDKYGFRRSLMACFAIFCVGYFLIGLAGMEYGAPITAAIGTRNYALIVLMLTAVGGSLIKPCVVGTVAITSSEKSKALGFSIYYTLVNLGGAIGPIIAYRVRTDLGIEYVLVMSSITSLMLLIGAFLFFKEPGEITEKKTFAQVFRDMLQVFRNVKFMTFLLIFSGFWMMFWQIFYSFPFYVIDVLKYEAFEFLETVDAFTLILITIPVTALVSKLRPVTAIALGFAISSLSWLIIGIGGTILTAIIGVAVYALGEAMQAPRFYEYVSSLAPKDQVGTFMGFAFLPVAIGSFTAGIIADFLRLNYLATDPPMMFYTLSGVGIISTVLMVIYNRIVSR
ncbi:MAG: MFS transporter [Cyclobacteriaceae bacterium]|nr:MFS transporter [Cyclobacteriaceae bacterium]